MLEDPGLAREDLVDALRMASAVEASTFTFVPGYDMRAATYQVATADAAAFLKVRFEIGSSVLRDGGASEASRASEVDLAERFFAPGGIVETVERV
jgi:hypothetical protein